MPRKAKTYTLEEYSNMNWKEYMKTSWWKKYSATALKDKECVCKICGRERWSKYKINTGGHVKGDWKKHPSRFNVHHCNYDNLGNEQPGDTITICSGCHTTAHALYDVAKRSYGWRIVYAEFCKQNPKWSYKPFAKRTRSKK